MNETVKAALLRMRDRTRSSVGIAADDVASLKRKLDASEVYLEAERGRLADIELHLKDNGVDLAAVDAEAARKPSAMQSIASGMGQGFSNLGALYPNGASQNANTARGAVNRFDPTTGLVKALDEA